MPARPAGFSPIQSAWRERAVPMRKWILIYLALACACVALLLLIIWALGGMGELETLSHDGIVALILTIVVTAFLSILLMGLSFYSARKGHDDEVMDGHTRHHNESRWWR